MTSMSTPGSMLMLVICLTTSAGEWMSRILLCILICHLSYVFVPSPHGDLRTISLRNLVGMRTGPLTFRFLLRALFLSSRHTFSRASTFLEVRVIRMRWILISSASTALHSKWHVKLDMDFVGNQNGWMKMFSIITCWQHQGSDMKNVYCNVVDKIYLCFDWWCWHCWGRGAESQTVTWSTV